MATKGNFEKRLVPLLQIFMLIFLNGVLTKFPSNCFNFLKAPNKNKTNKKSQPSSLSNIPSKL